MAIPFRTPKYKTQQLDQPVEVQLQLVRPSDNFRSESVPFQMLPLGAGRPAFWSLRKAFANKKLQDDYSGLLSSNSRQDPLEYNNNNNNSNGFKRSHEKMSALRALNDMYRVKNGETLVDYQGNSVRSDCLERSDYRSEWLGNSEVGKWVLRAQETKAKFDSDKAKCEHDDIVSQVEELDRIYVDTQTKLACDPASDPNAAFDVADNQTYTSLQMAMKNPMELLEIPELMEATAYEDVPNDSMEETLIVTPPPPPPPIVPKRDVNMEVDERVPPLPPKRVRKIPSAPVLEAAPEKNLPSPPANLKQNKQGLLSKFFVKKTKKEKEEKLEGDESPPYGVELTEAEHYALYTAMAPHATASEFDEFSVYYSPIEDGKIYKGT